MPDSRTDGARELVRGKFILVNEDNSLAAEIDPLGYLVEIPVEHHRVHEQSFYTASAVDTDVDIASPKYWLIRTPDSSTRIHIKASIGVNGAGLAELYENPTVNVDGTPMTTHNNYRNSTNTSTLLVFEDPTIGGDGTQLEARQIGSAAVSGPPINFGAQARQDAEWVFKPNEDYIIKFTTLADNNIVSITIQYYEV